MLKKIENLIKYQKNGIKFLEFEEFKFTKFLV